MAKFIVSSWNGRKQKWEFENQSDTAVKAKAWAKKESSIMTKTYKVQKIEEVTLATFQNGVLKK